MRIPRKTVSVPNDPAIYSLPGLSSRYLYWLHDLWASGIHGHANIDFTGYSPSARGRSDFVGLLRRIPVATGRNNHHTDSG